MYQGNKKMLHDQVVQRMHLAMTNCRTQHCGAPCIWLPKPGPYATVSHDSLCRTAVSIVPMTHSRLDDSRLDEEKSKLGKSDDRP